MPRRARCCASRLDWINDFRGLLPEPFFFRSEQWVLSAGQAQKEVTVNEALQRLDIFVAAAVEQEPVNEPPPTPAIGACYLVGNAPTGAWAGKPQTVAGYSAGGWRFVDPTDGMVVFLRSAAQFACYRSGSWEIGIIRGASLVIDGEQVVGARAPAIAPPSGGTTVDGEARAAIENVLAALRNHGLIDS